MDLPSDALALPAAADTGPEFQNRSEQGIRQLSTPPGRTIPPEVSIAQGVDLDAHDPALTDDGRRLCVAARKAGGRCQAPAIRDEVLCSLHAGRLDAAEGGRAKGRKLRLVAEEAENRAVEARLGTRAIVAAALREKHAEVRLAIHSLADRAAEGDRQAALALIPWINQGLGMPASDQPTEVRLDGESVDLGALDTASLKALLHTGTP